MRTWKSRDLHQCKRYKEEDTCPFLVIQWITRGGDALGARRRKYRYTSDAYRTQYTHGIPVDLTVNSRGDAEKCFTNKSTMYSVHSKEEKENGLSSCNSQIYHLQQYLTRMNIESSFLQHFD